MQAKTIIIDSWFFITLFSSDPFVIVAFLSTFLLSFVYVLSFSLKPEYFNLVGRKKKTDKNTITCIVNQLSYVQVQDSSDEINNNDVFEIKS